MARLPDHNPDEEQRESSPWDAHEGGMALNAGDEATGLWSFSARLDPERPPPGFALFRDKPVVYFSQEPVAKAASYQSTSSHIVVQLRFDNTEVGKQLERWAASDDHRLGMVAQIDADRQLVRLELRHKGPEGGGAAQEKRLKGRNRT